MMTFYIFIYDFIRRLVNLFLLLNEKFKIKMFLLSFTKETLSYGSNMLLYSVYIRIKFSPYSD